MPSDAAQADQVLLTLGPFTGLSNESIFRIPPGKAYNLANCVPNRRYNAFNPIRGRGPQFGAAIPGNGPVYSIGKFIVQQGGLPFYIVQTTDPATNGLLLSYVVWGASPTTPFNTISLPSIDSSITDNSPGSFEEFDQWMFFVNRDSNGHAFKIDKHFNCTEWQIRKGFAFQDGTFVSSGAITAINIYYRHTYSNAVQESSPNDNPYGPWSPTAQNFYYDIAISSDPQTTTINVYRIDQANAQWLFIGSIPNTSGYGGAPTGYARFTDSTPDTSVDGQTLVEHRDIPAPFYAITSHKDRMWGFGYNFWMEGSEAHKSAPSDLWYSNEGEPWGFDNTNQVIQINANQYGDVAVDIKSVGGTLVCLKTRSSWLLYGDDPNSFQPPQELGRNLGCVSKGSIVQAQGVLWWLSNQGVFQFDGNLAKISADIKSVLDSLTDADLAACTACFNDGMYWLGFPTLGLMYGYDPNSQSWWKSTMTSPFFSSDAEGLAGRPNSIDTVVGAVNNQLVPWFYGFGDPYTTGGGVTSTYRSGIWHGGRAGWFQFTWLEVIAEPNMVDDVQVFVTILVNPGTAKENDFTLGPLTIGSNNPIFLKHLPVQLQGMQVQLQLTCVADVDFEVFEVNLYGQKVRELVPGDYN